MKKIVKNVNCIFYVFEYSGWCIFLMSLIIFQVAQEKDYFSFRRYVFSVSFFSAASRGFCQNDMIVLFPWPFRKRRTEEEEVVKEKTPPRHRSFSGAFI